MQTLHDTIAAIATPPGFGGIAVLRLSGPDVLRVLGALFSPFGTAGKNGNFSFRPRYMHYGQLRDRDGCPLDAGLAVYIPGPASVTGEDVGEIHCHGGVGVTCALLEAAFAAGARPAGPGEFTRRAFVNGRMDLTQAEAVAELINAPTREGARLAAAKLDGSLARKLDELRESLDALRTQIFLTVDFPDENEELLPQEAFAHTVRRGRELVASLLESFERARLWREGALAVLVGQVNTGKSSLLNALLGRPRAIVSDEPGTTRDYIEEIVNIKGVPLRLVDTAGLRKDGGEVEAEGIRRADGLSLEADLLLFVADARYPLQADEYDFIQRHKKMLYRGGLLLLLNKSDLLSPEAAGEQRPFVVAGAPADLAEGLRACPCFCLSARTGTGLEQLAEGMRLALALPGMRPAGQRHTEGTREAEPEAGGRMTAEAHLHFAPGDIAPNLRQSQLLRKTGEELQALEQALVSGYPPDILGLHLEKATALLAEVTGATSNEELLERIFSSFCIGK